MAKVIYCGQLVPTARGPSPAGIFAVTVSVPVSIVQTSLENQLTT
jgi:hypothetical protein